MLIVDAVLGGDEADDGAGGGGEFVEVVEEVDAAGELFFGGELEFVPEATGNDEVDFGCSDDAFAADELGGGRELGVEEDEGYVDLEGIWI